MKESDTPTRKDHSSRGFDVPCVWKSRIASASFRWEAVAGYSGIMAAYLSTSKVL